MEGGGGESHHFFFFVKEATYRTPAPCQISTVFVNMFDHKKCRTSRKIRKMTNFITVEHIYEYGNLSGEKRKKKNDRICANHFLANRKHDKRVYHVPPLSLIEELVKNSVVAICASSILSPKVTVGKMNSGLLCIFCHRWKKEKEEKKSLISIRSECFPPLFLYRKQHTTALKRVGGEKKKKKKQSLSKLRIILLCTLLLSPGF